MKNPSMGPPVGVSADPKVLSHFFCALKQSKANKCQCVKRLKTVKKAFLNFFWKKVTQKFQKVTQKFQK